MEEKTGKEVVDFPPIAKAPVALAARMRWQKGPTRRMKAQLARDEQALYKRYGMNPDGTPSGHKPATAE